MKILTSSCKHCGRPTSHRKARDRPAGTQQRQGDACISCAERVRRGIPLPGHDYDCSSCGAHVVTEYGGGFPRPSSGGVCQGCMNRATRASRTAALPDCKGCGNPMVRRSEVRPVGSVVYSGRGLCRTCYGADREGRLVLEDDVSVSEAPVSEPLDERSRGKLELNAAQHERFLRARREREARRKASDVRLAYHQGRVVAVMAGRVIGGAGTVPEVREWVRRQGLKLASVEDDTKEVG